MTYKVQVTPNSRRESLSVLANGCLSIAVKEKAERGEANVRVRELLARHLGVPVKFLRLTRGQRGKNKVFELV